MTMTSILFIELKCKLICKKFLVFMEKFIIFVIWVNVEKEQKYNKLATVSLKVINVSVATVSRTI